MKKKRKKHFLKIIIIIWLVIVALNLAAWLAPGFSDWYADHITPIWVNIYGRITGLVSFSVGEVMLEIAIILTVMLVVLSILLIFLRKRTGYRKFMRRFYRVIIAVVTAVCLLMTLNCTVVYHTGTLDPNPDKEERTYTVKELEALRNYIVEQCNELSTEVERNEDGTVTYSGDLQETAKAALNAISDKYPRLSGYYPNVKFLTHSMLMCQMYMEGYYFPFSMEANVNRHMFITNMPNCFCHELSHVHGYIYEDEASFLAFVACTESDDAFFRYSGYLGVLNYVINSYINSTPNTSNEYYASLPQTNELVDSDNIFLTDEMWEKVESSSAVSTETVDKISDDLTDISLKINGVEDGMASYSRVVGLLLEYYDGVLY